MRKTPISARFTEQFIRANDQICFAALQQWEFIQHLRPLVASSPEKFTPDILPANPFAKTIHRKVDDLPKFSSEAEEIALQMGVIAAVEYVLAYIEDVQRLREQLVPETETAIINDAEEEQLRLKVIRWSGKSPTAGYFRTLGYFRLLRNHFAHVNKMPHQSFKSYVRSHGSPLNTFWKSGRTDVHRIDFRTLHSIKLVPDLAFGIMNLLRVSVQHIDHMIAESLPVADTVRWTVLQIRAVTQGHQLALDRLSSKVQKRLKMEWGIDESLGAVLNSVRAVASDA